jgi:hypothetical protein
LPVNEPYFDGLRLSQYVAFRRARNRRLSVAVILQLST